MAKITMACGVATNGNGGGNQLAMMKGRKWRWPKYQSGVS
jgi:hypothetical protein